ncbi:YvcK family protein [Anaerovibrio sp.]|uniref:gluconeogenesis factor YvcK family protein n=1 Tax=Anaerovibrio sp. TaxID=1872532 RepID=UPI0026100C59|nr:YvcK family protein [Anaerovibrio sp.]MDD6597066.1 YvcK family protein [Anaerovibrio sp.]MDD7677026.1 YvcK family protein [Anaerovibrio sp.]MDY2603733.1 YvcK family protein [Anaerovibrio sp.]
MHLLKWLYPGMRFKRWLLLFAGGVMLASLGIAVVFNYKYIDNIEEAIFRAVYLWSGSYDYTFTALVGMLMVLLGFGVMLVAARFVIRSVITVLLPANSSEKLVDLIYEKRKLGKGPAITVVGGGHGLSVLLRGIKQATSNVTAVVTVADDGGSSGRLREELGMIPPGDLRNCLVALADTEPLMEKLFQHRFEGDSQLSGHSFGNLFIAAMAQVTGDVETALKESSKVLAVKGRVLPASKEFVRLDAIMEDGSIVCGESKIPEANKKIHRVKLFPEHVEAVQSSLDALRDAEAIVLGPGSLYTSIMPNLLVEGIGDALCRSRAVKIYICNVMTQPGETDGYTASMHVKAILDHAGRNAVDYVIVNSTPVPEDLKKKYAEAGAYPVIVDEDVLKALGVGVIKADLITNHDAIHHDPKKLAESVMQVVYETL